MLAMYSGQIGSFSSRDIFFFHHVGIRINSRLSFFIHVGWKETFVFSYKIYFIHCRKFFFLLIGVLGISLYGSNEPTLNLELLGNQAYPVTLEILFLYWIFLLFCRQIHRLYFFYILGYLTPTARHITVPVCFSLES
uniref:Uncharacterized protein n=1 Tax=Brassica campestris TaxID=3711 RepID=A0A3P6DRL5_BRACM|nr:unnamed protein product [Brassica rapa]